MFFKTGFFCITALAVLELTLYTRLGLGSTCLCLSSANFLIHRHTHTPLLLQQANVPRSMPSVKIDKIDELIFQSFPFCLIEPFQSDQFFAYKFYHRSNNFEKLLICLYSFLFITVSFFGENDSYLLGLDVLP